MKYRKNNITGKVTVRGILQIVGTTTPGTTILNLPIECRPLYAVPITVLKNNVSPFDAAFWLTCAVDGNIVLGYNQTFPKTGTTDINAGFEVEFTANS